MMIYYGLYALFSCIMDFVRELTRVILQYSVFTTIKLPTTPYNCGSSGDFREMSFCRRLFLAPYRLGL